MGRQLTCPQDTHVREARVDVLLALAEQITEAWMPGHAITKEWLPFVYGRYRLIVMAHYAASIQPASPAHTASVTRRGTWSAGIWSVPGTCGIGLFGFATRGPAARWTTITMSASRR